MSKLNKTPLPKVIGGLAIILAFYPFLVSWASLGLTAVFQSFAADAFYYFAIAKNSSWIPLFSFDGVTPTNGFHPLYQLLLKLSLSHPALSGNQYAQLIYVYWVSAILVAFSAGIIVHRLIALKQPPALTLLCVIPGFIFFILTTINPNYASLWSYANGMESALSLFLFACYFSLMLDSSTYLEGRKKRLVLISIILGLIVLARLDDIFLLLAICAPLLLDRKPPLQQLKRMLALLGIPIFLVSIYCTINFYYAGTFLPISGQVKKEISFIPNILNLMNTFLPLKEILRNDVWLFWNSLSWRALLNTIPIIVAICFLIFFNNRSLTKKNKENNFDYFLSALALYIIFKGGFNIIFVDLWNQGHWYYPISIVTSNILVLRMLVSEVYFRNYSIEFDFRRYGLKVKKYFSHVMVCIFIFLIGILFWSITYTTLTPVFHGIGRDQVISALCAIVGIVLLSFFLLGIYKKWIPSFNIPLPILLVVLFILITANGVTFQKKKNNYNKQYQLFWENRVEVSEGLKRFDPDIKLLSFDDGIIAYSLNIPVMSGLGFALDKEAANAKKKGKLLDVAERRGFKYFTSMNYMPSFTADIGDEISPYLQNSFNIFNLLNDSRWSYYLAYEDKKTGLKIIRFEKAKK